MQKRARDRMQAICYPTLFLVLIVLLWQLVVRLFSVPEYVLPAPTDVVSSFEEVQGTVWKNAGVTLLETVSGFAAAVVAGLVLGSLISQSRTAFLTIYPYLVALSTVPIIAVAPLLIVWLGYGLTPKIVVSALIAFLPIVINTVRGLNSTDYRALLLMDSIAAGRFSIFVKVRLPTATPYLFSAFKTAVPLATVGAVVGEFLGSDNGLGALIIRASSRLQMDLLFVAILLLGLMGVCLFLVISLLENVFLRWYDGTTVL